MAEPAERAPRPERARSIRRFALSVAVLAASIGWLAYEGRTENYLAALRASDPLALLPGAACLALIGVVRGLRLGIVSRRAFGLPLLRVSVLHNFLGGIAPARLGELALPVMLNRGWRIPLAEGVGVLFVIRVYELLVLVGIAGVAAAVALGPADGWTGLALAAALAAAATALALTRWVPKLGASFRGDPGSGRAGRALASLARTSADLSARLPSLLAVTLAIWCLMVLTFHTISRAYGVAVPWYATTLGLAAAAFAFALPVNGVGSLGPPQILWATVLRSFDADYESAIVVGVAAQLVGLVVHGSMALALTWVAHDPAPGDAAPGWRTDT